MPQDVVLQVNIFEQLSNIILFIILVILPNNFFSLIKMLLENL